MYLLSVSETAIAFPSDKYRVNEFPFHSFARYFFFFGQKYDFNAFQL
jgi:hypothetical protein